MARSRRMPASPGRSSMASTRANAAPHRLAAAVSVPPPRASASPRQAKGQGDPAPVTDLLPQPQRLGEMADRAGASRGRARRRPAGSARARVQAWVAERSEGLHRGPHRHERRRRPQRQAAGPRRGRSARRPIPWRGSDPQAEQRGLLERRRPAWCRRPSVEMQIRMQPVGRNGRYEGGSQAGKADRAQSVQLLLGPGDVLPGQRVSARPASARPPRAHPAAAGSPPPSRLPRRPAAAVRPGSPAR